MCTSYNCCCTGSAQLDFYLIKHRCHFSIWLSDGSSRRILGQTWRLGPSDSQVWFYPVGFCKIGLHKQAHLFFRSKNKNLKLGIRSHNKRPYTILQVLLLRLKTEGSRIFRRQKIPPHRYSMCYLMILVFIRAKRVSNCYIQEKKICPSVWMFD